MQDINYTNEENKEELENIQEFRKAYNDILYHYDSSKERENIRALTVKKQNIFSRLANRVKNFFYFS
jgi:predicted lipid-binding transport protein (Tim44 family)